MSLSGIRSKIQTALLTVSGINEAYVQVPSVVNPPCGFCSLRPSEPVSYDFTAQNATLVYHFNVEVLVNKGGTLEQAQNDMDPFLQNTGSTSVKAAVEAISWGTTASVCRVVNVTNYGPATYGGVEHLGARLSLDVWV